MPTLECAAKWVLVLGYGHVGAGAAWHRSWVGDPAACLGTRHHAALTVLALAFPCGLAEAGAAELLRGGEAAAFVASAQM